MEIEASQHTLLPGRGGKPEHAKAGHRQLVLDVSGRGNLRESLGAKGLPRTKAELEWRLHSPGAPTTPEHRDSWELRMEQNRRKKPVDTQPTLSKGTVNGCK